MVRIAHDLSGFLDYSFFPEGVQVCQLNSDDLRADIDNVTSSQMKTVHSRGLIGPPEEVILGQYRPRKIAVLLRRPTAVCVHNK